MLRQVVKSDRNSAGVYPVIVVKVKDIKNWLDKVAKIPILDTYC
ncbi:hypothetical protein [Calothrix sp. NIES-2098]